MIKKEDIKVGLKFLLPCERIERREDKFLYFVNTMESYYLGLSEPTDAFRVKSVKNDSVYCDVRDVTNVRVNLDVLQKNGFYPEYAEKLMDEWKNSIIGDSLNWSELPFNSIIMGEPNRKTDANRFKKITDEMYDTFKAKNHDYGSSFSNLFKECGMIYAYGHMAEKLERVKSLMKDEAKVKGEGMKDSLLDLANYAILTIMELERKEEEKWEMRLK